MEIREICPEWWEEDRSGTMTLWSVICEPLMVSKLMKILGSTFPLGKECGHLKRARKHENGVQILLSTSDCLEGNQRSALTELGIEGLLPVEAPLQAPRTSEESKQMSAVWPTVFRLSSVPWSPTALSEAEKKEIAAIAETVRADFLRIKTAVFECSRYCGLYLRGRLAAEGAADGAHPLRHGVMCAINNLGEQIVKIEGKRLRGAEPPDSAPSTVLDRDQYYATNCDAFVAGEPCVMCSMALVHSRIRRLFIIVDGATWTSPNGGVVGSGVRVPFCPALNHHYPAYLVFKSF